MDPASTPPAPAGLLRRLGAQLYDFLLVVALWFFATFMLLPLTGGEAITPATQGGLEWFYRAWLVAVAFGYFGFCWVRGGQTLGLRAWRSRLLSVDGTVAGWAIAALRFAIGAAVILSAVYGAWLLARPGWKGSDSLALFLLLPAIANLAWIAFDAEGRSLQDLAGRMRVVRVPR
jgi:uncharacterized RDD family membrane protein YckC